MSAGTAVYYYNALGQMVEKDGLGGIELQMYDEAGHLLSEYGIHGVLIEETVWMDNTPVAVIQPSGSTVAFYYIHADHLNTPRKITRPSDNGLMWRWDPDTFGSLQPNSNPAGLGAFTYNLRFPGMYFMNESWLFTSGFRTYGPTTGRYLESDPIGLGGGINTYADVGGNPISRTDPKPLLKKIPVSPWGGPYFYKIEHGANGDNTKVWTVPDRTTQERIGLTVLSNSTDWQTLYSK